MAEAAGDIYGPINAETGDTSQFTSVTGAGTTTFTATAGSKDHGNYGFALVYNGSNATAYGTKTFTASDIEWHRFYIYVDPLMDLNSTYSVLYNFYLISSGTQILKFGVYSQASGTPTRWVFNYLSTAQTSATNFSLGNWHLIEIKWVKDASVGGGALYVDSSLILSDLDQDSTAYTCGSIDIGNPSAGKTPDAGNYIYFDDLIGTTTQRGPYADASEPEINLKQNITDIPNGGDYTFTSTKVGSYTNVIFTIENTGTADLNLTGTPKVDITSGYACTQPACPGTAEYVQIYYWDNSDSKYKYTHKCDTCSYYYYLDNIYTSGDTSFTVTADPSTPVAASSSTTFTVKFEPTGTGSKAASASIPNNDATENPYEFTLEGTGLTATAAKFVTTSSKNCLGRGTFLSR